MPVSRKCDECFKVRQTSMYLRDDGSIVYLCRPCRRELDYPDPSAACGQKEGDHAQANA